MKKRLPGDPVIAAHEAGMHDRRPRPDVCRQCAREAAQNGR